MVAELGATLWLVSHRDSPGWVRGNDDGGTKCTVSCVASWPRKDHPVTIPLICVPPRTAGPMALDGEEAALLEVSTVCN